MENVLPQLTTLLSKMLGIDPADINQDATLSDLDLDSITTVEFADVLKEEMGVSIDESLLINSTLREISDTMSEQLGEEK